MLAKQFNPRTLQGAMTAQYREQHPQGASKISELPERLLEWERDLRICLQEGRTPPSDEMKRLALLRMIPAKER